MKEDVRKKVDESWKAQVEKEKATAKSQNQPYHQPSFSIFISSMSMQAMIALGRLENPLTNKKEKNLDQARYLIDTLDIIKNKTQGNLSDEEKNLLEDSLFNLRMMYVEEKEAEK